MKKFIFIGDESEYRWDINPIIGKKYTKSDLALMFGENWKNHKTTLVKSDWKIIKVNKENNLENLKQILIQILDKGQNRIDITLVLALINTLKNEH